MTDVLDRILSLVAAPWFLLLDVWNSVDDVWDTADPLLGDDLISQVW